MALRMFRTPVDTPAKIVAIMAKSDKVSLANMNNPVDTMVPKIPVALLVPMLLSIDIFK